MEGILLLHSEGWIEISSAKRTGKRISGGSEEFEEKYNVKVNLVDSEGNVQVDTNSINIDNARLYDVQYSKEKDGYRYFDNGDYVIMRYFEKINWYLVIRRTINNNSDTTLKITLCFICTALVSIIVFLSGTVFRKKTEHKE